MPGSTPATTYPSVRSSRLVPDTVSTTTCWVDESSGTAHVPPPERGPPGNCEGAAVHATGSSKLDRISFDGRPLCPGVETLGPQSDSEAVGGARAHRDDPPESSRRICRSCRGIGVRQEPTACSTTTWWASGSSPGSLYPPPPVVLKVRRRRGPLEQDRERCSLCDMPIGSSSSKKSRRPPHYPGVHRSATVSVGLFLRRQEPPSATPAADSSAPLLPARTLVLQYGTRTERSCAESIYVTQAETRESTASSSSETADVSGICCSLTPSDRSSSPAGPPVGVDGSGARRLGCLPRSRILTCAFRQSRPWLRLSRTSRRAHRAAIQRYATARSADPAEQLLLVFDALEAWST